MEDPSAIQVAVRVRPLNEKERADGLRNCVSFDEATKQVVLSAVDKGTLLQLRGAAAKGYAFDRRYGPGHTSDDIYDECVAPLVDNLFKGYNATVLAYGQTGSGKTLTMSGGVAQITGAEESGVIRRAAQHILANVAALRRGNGDGSGGLKPGEAVAVRAYALELYNEELRDLYGGGGGGGAPRGSGHHHHHHHHHASHEGHSGFGGSSDGGGLASRRSSAAGGLGGAAAAAAASASSSADGGGGGGGVRIAERVGRDGRAVAEVAGAHTVEVADADELIAFFARCFDNRAVGATAMNDRSSRSHAIYTVLLSRTLVDVSADGGRVRTTSVESRFNLVDLAGSERVKRSGATGAAFREACAINGGLLALGNVIVALSGGQQHDPDGGGAEQQQQQLHSQQQQLPPLQPAPAVRSSGGGGGGSFTATQAAQAAQLAAVMGGAGRARHVPYRDSKLTRLLQDSLGGNSLTLLVACVSACEADFEETNSTLKYSNRACRIRNSPLPNKHLLLEEDLLPMLPAAAGGGAGINGAMSVTQVQMLLSDHGRMREQRERREAERRWREEKRAAELRSLRDAQHASPGYARLRMAAYDDARKRLTAGRRDATTLGFGETVGDDGGLLGSLKGEERTAGGASSGSGSIGGRPLPPAGARAASATAAARPASALPFARRFGSVTAGAGGGRSGGAPPRPASAEPGVAGGGRSGGSSATGSACATPRGGGSGLSGSGGSRATPPPAAAAKLALDKLALARDDDGEASPRSARSVGTIKAVYDDGGDSSSVAQQQQRQQQAASASPALDVLAFGEPPPGYSLSNGSTPATTPKQQQQETPPPPREKQPAPQLLARFRVNHADTVSVFRAVSMDDFGDVLSLLPQGTALPAEERMTYLLARLERAPFDAPALTAALGAVEAGAATPAEAVGPAVGCLMATFGTRLIRDVVFEFDDPEPLAAVPEAQRELWGLQIPHTPLRPPLAGLDAGAAGVPPSPPPPPLPLQQPATGAAAAAACWSSADRLNVSVGLMYALCGLADEVGATAGFCVPRPQLLRRWLQAGVAMKQVAGPAALIYPPAAADFAYYKASTVAWFRVAEVRASLARVLSSVGKNGGGGGSA